MHRPEIIFYFFDLGDAGVLEMIFCRCFCRCRPWATVDPPFG